MLSKPSHGWTTLTIGDITISGISYICDPHFALCEAFQSYLKPGWDSSGIVRFDLEGSTAIIVLTCFGATVIADAQPTKTCELSRSDMKAYASELADDLERDFDAWIREWGYPDSDEERAEMERDLRESIEDLRRAIIKA